MEIPEDLEGTYVVKSFENDGSGYMLTETATVTIPPLPADTTQTTVTATAYLNST